MNSEINIDTLKQMTPEIWNEIKKYYCCYHINGTKCIKKKKNNNDICAPRMKRDNNGDPKYFRAVKTSSLESLNQIESKSWNQKKGKYNCNNIKEDIYNGAECKKNKDPVDGKTGVVTSPDYVTSPEDVTLLVDKIAKPKPEAGASNELRGGRRKKYRKNKSKKSQKAKSKSNKKSRKAKSKQGKNQRKAKSKSNKKSRKRHR